MRLARPIEASARFRRSSLMDALDCDRRGFAAANAQGRHPAGQAMALEGVQQGHDDARAGGADRMAERAGAAMNVEPILGNAEIALCGHGDDRESLVDLEEIDVADGP